MVLWSSGASPHATITMWPRAASCFSLHMHPLYLDGGVRGSKMCNLQMSVILFLRCLSTFFFATAFKEGTKPDMLGYLL